MYMCTYICGAGKASVRMLCLRARFHVETCTDEFSLELASSLVHRPNCCISLGPQPQLEIRFSPPWAGCFPPRVLFSGLGTLVLLDTGVWNAEELQNHLFFQPWKTEKNRTAWKLGKSHLPQARYWCPLHHQSHTGESPTAPTELHQRRAVTFFWKLHCSLLLQQQRASLGEGLWFAVYKPIKKTQMKYPAGKVKSNEVVCCEKW